MRFTPEQCKAIAAQAGKPVDQMVLPPVRKRRKNEESLLQQRVVEWWDAWAPLNKYDIRDLHAVPNGAVFGSGVVRIIRAKTLLREGLRVGFPDLHWTIARHGFHGLLLELKLPHTNPGEAQREYHQHLKIRGYMVTVARTFEETVAVVTGYLK